METDIKKSAKQRRRHEQNVSSQHNGIGGVNYGGGSFKPVHGAVGEDLFSMGASDIRFSPPSPQGPDPYTGVSSERRLGAGRGPHGRHTSGHFNSAMGSSVPNGPLWSQMSGPFHPSGTSDISDFYGIGFDDDMLPPPTSELSARDLEAGANSMGFLMGEEGIDTEEDQALKSLLELARENLTLKHQLKHANQELSRLQDAVQKHQSERHLRKQKQMEQESQSRYWTLEEHHKFLEAIENFGPKDVKAIATFVGSRSATQVRTHAQKYFMKLAREKPMQSGNDAENGNSSSEATEEASRSSSMARRGPSKINPNRSADDSLVPSKASSRSPLSSGDCAAEDSSQSRSSRGSSCGPRGDDEPQKPSDSYGFDYAKIKVENKAPCNGSSSTISTARGNLHQRAAAAAAAVSGAAAAAAAGVNGSRGGRKRAASQADGGSDDEGR